MNMFAKTIVILILLLIVVPVEARNLSLLGISSQQYYALINPNRKPKTVSTQRVIKHVKHTYNIGSRKPGRYRPKPKPRHKFKPVIVSKPKRTNRRLSKHYVRLSPKVERVVKILHNNGITSINHRWIMAVAGAESNYGANTKVHKIRVCKRRKGRLRCRRVKASRASGIMQVIPSTRRLILKRYSFINNYRYDNTTYQLLLGAVYLHMLRKEFNLRHIESTYLFYVLGPKYAKRIHKGKLNSSVRAYIPYKVYVRNRNLFSRRGKPITVAQLKQRFLRKVRR